MAAREDVAPLGAVGRCPYYFHRRFLSDSKHFH